VHLLVSELRRFQHACCNVKSFEKYFFICFCSKKLGASSDMLVRTRQRDSPVRIRVLGLTGKSELH